MSNKIVMRYGAQPNYDREEEGGGETVTTLWANADPTSSFAAQTITLSDLATNYKKLRIEVYRSDGNYTVDYDMAGADKFYSSSSTGRMCICAKSADNTNIYSRYIYFNGGYDKLYISNGARWNAAATSSNIAKPAVIYGVN